MNFINRAWKYVTRRLSKSILLGLTFFIVGNLILTCLGIVEASNNAKKIVRQSMNPIVTYEVDYEKFWNENGSSGGAVEYPSISVEDILSIAEDERVKAVNLLFSSTTLAEDIRAVPVRNDIESEEGEEEIFTSYYGGGKEPNVFLSGNIDDNMIELVDGTYTIIDGRFYTKEEFEDGALVGLVTKELAELNGLTLGDSVKIMLSTWLHDQLLESGLVEEDELYREIEIIGIYDTIEDVDRNSDEYNWMSDYESPKNKILLPGKTIGEMIIKSNEYSNLLYPRGEESVYQYEEYDWDMFSTGRAVFLLNDASEVDNFMKTYEHKTTDYILFDANTKAFDEVSKPLNSLSTTATTIFLIIVFNSIVIVSLIIALTLKTREFEIGILLSTGASKLKIIAQLFLEMFIVTVVGFTLAIGTGLLLAGRVGDEILMNQINSQEEDLDEQYGYTYYSIYEKDYFTEVSQEDLVKQYKVEINAWIVLQIYTLGIFVVFISILIPGVMIMRLNPKQILLN